jgi:hypothetical protein
LKCVNSNRTKISLTSRGKDSSTEETRKNFVRIKKVRLDKILAVVIAVKHPGEGESTLYTDGISFVFKRNPHYYSVLQFYFENNLASRMHFLGFFALYDWK